MIEAKRELGIVGNVNYLEARFSLNLFFQQITFLQRDSKIIIEASKNNHDYDRFSVEVYDALKRLWNDSGIQQCYERRNEYHLPDSTKQLSKLFMFKF
jgi:hypothetical protein